MFSNDDDFPNIEKLVDKYFFTLSDRGNKFDPGENVPEQFRTDLMKANKTKAYIDGTAYFKAIDKEIERLIITAQGGKKCYFYMSAWWLGLVQVGGRSIKIEVDSSFKSIIAKISTLNSKLDLQWSYNLPSFPGFVLPSGIPLFLRLQEMVKVGVDVRILAWTSPFIPKYKQVANQASGILALNLHTLLSVNALRQIPGMADKVMLNTLSHPFGGAHLKMFICGHSERMRAYTSGLDPAPGRLNEPPDLANPNRRGWHDIGVRVGGQAAQGIYNFYAQLWNEQQQRAVDLFLIDSKEIPSRTSSTPKIEQRAVVSVQSNATQYVQVLRTTPQMNFSTTGPETLPGSSFLRWMLTTYSEFKRPPLSFAKDGLFEFKVALKKAISQAERYIFIADQGFYGMEIMDWINARIKQKPDLKVILLYGADPADPPSGFLHEAINNHLVGDLKPVFDDFDFLVPNIGFFTWDQTVVHSKVTIIDDKWCAIGSANCMRRSLYTDMELSISILDPVAPSFVKKFRRDLWLRYCGILPRDKAATLLFDPEEDKRKEFLDLDIALGIWKAKWATQQPSVQLLKTIQPKIAPFTDAPKIAFSQEKYDIEDADSRMKF